MSADKPAATGSGEPLCVRCNQPEYDPIHRTANYGHEFVPTPPVNQPTVTLDRETWDNICISAERDVPPMYAGRLLALLRAAEQK